MIANKTELSKFINNGLNNISNLKQELFFSDKASDNKMTQVLMHVLSKEGKQIRPQLTLLWAKIFGNPNRSTYLSSILVEVLHQATLLHDDVVDNATKRRGELSANVLFGNKTSVLVGDYLLSKMLETCSKEEEFKLLEIMSTTLVNLSKGELIQLEANSNLNISVENLLGIAKMKTASLIVASCISGANSSKATKEDLNKVKAFGESFGLAYQIKDDILDYNETNKEIYKDLKEKKINIPFAFALNEASLEDKKQILATFNKDALNEDDFDTIKGFIIFYNGFKKSQDLYDNLIKESLSYVTDFDKEGLLTEFVNKFSKRDY